MVQAKWISYLRVSTGKQGRNGLGRGLLAGRLGVSAERIVVTADRLGNTGSAAIWLALAQLRPGDEGRFARVTFAEASVALGEKMEALSEALDESRPAG